MTIRLRLADPTADEELSASAHVIRVAPGTRRQAGVDVGDAVAVEGGDATVATLGEDCERLPDSIALAGDAVRRNAGAAPGAAVTVDSVTAEAAASIAVRPTRSFSLDGDGDALARALTGRYLTAGDRVEVRLFGGSVAVSLAVVETDPPGPVAVTADTAVVVRDRGGDGSDGSDGPTLPLAPPDGLGGLDDEGAALRRLVARPLSDPNAHAAVGVRAPAGVLVHGPSGVGKTRLVRTVASEAGVSVHDVSPTDCEDRGSLATAFRAAVDAAPTILFVEDVAAAAPNPERDGGRRTHSALGWLLDRVRDRADLVVVGEATAADAVDPALRRGGRFDAEVRVDVPDRTGRREALAVHAADLRIGDDVDLAALAARTHGFTGADLEAALVDAATRAVDRADADGAGATVGRADLDAAVEAVGPTTLRDVGIETPSVSYDDVGGLEAATGEVVRTVEWPLRHPELFERLSASAPTGVLLYGPPGTGKTLLAKAVAGSTDANFLAVDGPELLDRYVGESERAVRELFERARRTAPAVVFLDELDALGPARRDTDTGAAERVVSQLLTELDGLSGRGNVAVLAATNRPESIDPALLRPGRVERRVEVPLPDRAARREILAVHLDDVPTEDLDLRPVAAATAGYTGSDLAGVVREAAMLAMEEFLGAVADEPLDGLVVEHRHLRRAVERGEPSVDASEWRSDREDDG